MKRVLFFVTGCVLFSYLSCLQEEGVDFKYPRIYTDPIDNITPNGARFTAHIDFANIKEITDFGFIWGEDSNLSRATFTFPSDTLIGNEFYTDVTSSLVAQKIYFVRSFVKKSGKTVLGNIVSFKSLGSEGPKITGLVPELAAFGDTVRVTGKNFNSTAKLIYGSQDISFSIVKAEKNTITFVLPNTILVDPSEALVSVSIEGNLTKSPLPLKLDLDRILPKILSITPSTIKACDTVTINGKNFVFDEFTTVFNSLGALNVIKLTNEKIVCIVKTIPKNDLFFFVSNERFFTTSQSIDIIEQRPEIISVSPLIYKSKDIVTVKVKNFPYCDNSIYASINNYTFLEILSRSKDEIKLRLPEGCSGSFNIVFTFAASNYVDTQQFETPLLSPQPPEIYSIEPSHGSFGDEIVIKGNNLKGVGANMLDTVSTTNTEIRGRLTEFAAVKDNGFTDVMLMGCGSLVKEDAFTYDPIEILDFNPKVITSRSQEITITGKNFTAYNNEVTIGSYTLNVASNDNQTLVVRADAFLPDITQSVNESVSIAIRNSLGNQATSPTPLQINCEASWSRLNDFPFEGVYLGISFSLAGKGYAGANNGNFWQYDAALDSWQAKAHYPGHVDEYKASTSTNDKAYVGLGMNYNSEWWEYDPSTDEWTQKKDYPGSYAGAGFAFEIGGKVYAGGGSGSAYNYEFWEYSPASDSWTRKADIPIRSGRSTANLSFKGKGYIYGTSLNSSQDVEAAYDPNSNTWTTRTLAPFENGGNYTCMIFDDYVVFGGQSLSYPPHNLFFKVVPGSGNVSVAESAGAITQGQISFAIGNYGYWGLGLNLVTYQGSFEVWRFDPSKFQ